ncbi:MAG: type II toxin-antitoxin system HicB family antitoxin [Leptospiraceae bacterium]|nr:type II toxin-antitoxin system HicB family antitoxin [Leptospiraceae bacterium]
MEYTIRIYQGEKYLIGFCDEIPGAMSQGSSLAELRENMQDAIRLMLKPIVVEEFEGQNPVIEKIAI